jgi:hypothetical protein
VKKKLLANIQSIIELSTQKIVIKLSKYGFGIRPRSGIQNPERKIFRIPDLGVKKAPDPRSRIRIRNTDSFVRNEEATRLRAGDLLEALTLKSADELFDMEKMEIVGDVFLKYRCNCLCWFLFIC